MRLAELRREDRGGRDGPQVAMVGFVIGRICIRDMKTGHVVSVVRMVADVIVGEVPENADRLGRDQRYDREEHHDPGPIGRETEDHGGQSITPRTIGGCALFGAASIAWTHFGRLPP
jgi:hypothetical protein